MVKIVAASKSVANAQENFYNKNNKYIPPPTDFRQPIAGRDVLDDAPLRGLLHLRVGQRRHLRLLTAVLRRRQAGAVPQGHGAPVHGVAHAGAVVRYRGISLPLSADVCAKRSLRDNVVITYVLFCGGECYFVPMF